MKKPNIIQRFKAGFNSAFFPTIVNPLVPSPIRQITATQGASIYPYTNEQTYITKGYNKNAWVYTIVNKCAKKFGQLPWYHYKIKNTERKTWFNEYIPLTKGLRDDPKLLIELKKMRHKSVDQVATDSKVSRLLNKPNRNESRALFHESLYGWKLLSGEGNAWMSNGEGSEPTELFIIPKSALLLVKGGSIWDIDSYRISIEGFEFQRPKNELFMWRFPTYDTPNSQLTHLRGQSPLDAGLLSMQAMNEANERLVHMNKNQGVAGIVYDKLERERPTLDQITNMRRQFHSIVNDKDLAGTIAYMTGELGFMQFGLDAEQLKLLEQTNVHFEALCGIFDVPYQLFANPGSYENRKQYKRDFIYDNIAVAAYGLRDEYNAKLIRAFNLDSDRDVIDVDILSLPELSHDQKELAEFVDKVGARISLNEGRELLGYDRSTDPNMDKHYIGSGLQTLDQLNADLGTGLDREVELLDE